MTSIHLYSMKTTVFVQRIVEPTPLGTMQQYDRVIAVTTANNFPAITTFQK